MRQDGLSRASIFGGILFLVLGTISADLAFAFDYDTEFTQCVMSCQSTNGKDSSGVQWYDSNGNPSIDECIKNGCAKYYGISCAACKTCPGGGMFTPCTSTGSNCGGFGVGCTNGMCGCKSNLIPTPMGNYYECYCVRP